MLSAKDRRSPRSASEPAAITAADLEPVTLDRARLEACLERARISIVIDLAGVACAVSFDELSTAAIFARRYRELLSSRAPVRDAFAVRDPELGALFGCATGPVFRWPHAAVSDEAFVFFAEAVALTAFFTSCEHVVSLHAAAVGVDDGVAAIIGDSHAGKSTTAIACARRGMALYSDERCVVSGRAVVPFPRAMTIREGGRALLAAEDVPGDGGIGARLRGRCGDWRDVQHVEVLGRRARYPARALRWAFVVAGIGEHPRVERVPTTVALRASLRWANCADEGLARLARLLAIFEGVACYRLWLGRPDESARLIGSIVSRTRAA